MTVMNPIRKKFGEEFQSLIENFEMIAATGTASESLKQIALEWNSEIFERVDGFSRYSNALMDSHAKQKQL